MYLFHYLRRKNVTNLKLHLSLSETAVIALSNSAVDG